MQEPKPGGWWKKLKRGAAVLLLTGASATGAVTANEVTGGAVAEAGKNALTAIGNGIDNLEPNKIETEQLRQNLQQRPAKDQMEGVTAGKPAGQPQPPANASK